VIDHKTEEWQAQNARARRAFIDLTDNYVLRHPSGKRDVVTTEKRREMLRGILCTLSDKTPVYSEMLRLARAALDGFDREDSKVHASNVASPRGRPRDRIFGDS
jgi:hypothetical protein